jgi:hypothetical protein
MIALVGTFSSSPIKSLSPIKKSNHEPPITEHARMWMKGPQEVRESAPHFGTGLIGAGTNKAPQLAINMNPREYMHAARMHGET